MDTNTFEGSNGRLYRTREDGRVVEVSDPKRDAKRKLDAISAGHTITGLRVIDADKPNDPAIVVTLTPSEAKAVMTAVKSILKARSTAGNA